MKKVAIILLVLGLTLFAAGIVVAAIDIKTAGDIPGWHVAAMFPGGLLSIIALFMLSRAREGIRLLEITDKDRAQFKEMRQELGFRRLLGRFVGIFAGLFILAGFLPSIVPDSSLKPDWRVNASLIVIGFVLAFSATRLLKPSR